MTRKGHRREHFGLRGTSGRMTTATEVGGDGGGGVTEVYLETTCAWTSITDSGLEDMAARFERRAKRLALLCRRSFMPSPPKMNFISYMRKSCLAPISPSSSLAPSLPPSLSRGRGKRHSQRQLKINQCVGPPDAACVGWDGDEATASSLWL